MRLLIEPYRNDRSPAGAGEAMFTALHALLGRRRSIALEIHLDRRSSGSPLAWFAVRCPPELAGQLEAALRRSWPSVRLREFRGAGDSPLAGVHLVRRTFPWADELVAPPDGSIEPLLRAMAAAGPPATLVVTLRPAARVVELACAGEGGPQPLLWASPIVLAADRGRARAIASALAGGPPRLAIRRGAPTRIRRSPLALFRPWELARLWGLPSPEFAAVPCVRRPVPVAPAPPGIARSSAEGLLRDEHGGLTIDEGLRRQHIAVVGAVEQGKTSLLVASTAADLRREDCAVIVLDPKGDAADAVLSVVPRSRTCTLLDMAAPTAGFNPLTVASTPDAIADHVVAALRGLFSEGEVRGSSDRYLRNALIAALACSPAATLWDAARLLEVGETGRVLRARVAERLVELPAYAEFAGFFAHELPAQLADARAATTANRVVLVGNLTRDPELRSTAAGTSVCRMRIACSTTWRNRETGEIDERPNYFDVTTFGASGEACARFLAKGRPIAVDGRLEWHEWQNADGETRQAVGVVADSVQFLGSRPADDGPAGTGEAADIDAEAVAF